jgi:hypothetical protein
MIIGMTRLRYFADSLRNLLASEVHYIGLNSIHLFYQKIVYMQFLWLLLLVDGDIWERYLLVKGN